MPQPVRILYIGETGADLIAAELRRAGWQPSFERVLSAVHMRVLLAQSWDIAVSDFSVGEFGAIEALTIIHETSVDLPLIVVSNRSAGDEVLAALKAGAADHLSRRNLMRLNAAVEREIRGAKARRERILLEEQFRQAQKMEAVGRLAGGVAHDFNNLLTVITGYSDLLLAGRDLKDGQRSALEEIRRSAERGGQLTGQLLAFSRRQPMQSKTVGINALVMQTEKMLRRVIGEDIELVTIPAAAEDAVEADPSRLEQVIMNLVVNARDAMPDGGKLTIETGAVTLDRAFSAKQLGVAPGRYVTISIGDTGTGMSEETLSHIFEPFFTTKGAGRGTGLGLATVYGIVVQSGGAIKMFSDLGKGTTARIYLPISAKTVLPPVVDQRSTEGLAGAETVLLVEDEARVRKLIGDILTARGYKVLIATRGEEAVRICKDYQGAIHLALVDVVMPEMSGPDLVRQIEPRLTGKRVLYISGYTDEAIVHHGVESTGAAFLQKPFMPEALLRKIREVLDAPATAKS